MTIREYLLKASKDTLDALTLPLKLKQDKHNLNGWILAKESESGKLAIKIAELKSSKQIDPDAILDAIYAKELVDAKLKDGQELYHELFETNVDDSGLPLKL